MIISTLNVITQHPVLKIKLGQKRQIKCFYINWAWVERQEYLLQNTLKKKYQPKMPKLKLGN